MRFNIRFNIELIPSKAVPEYIIGVTRNFSRDGFCFVSEDFDVQPEEIIDFKTYMQRGR